MIEYKDCLIFSSRVSSQGYGIGPVCVCVCVCVCICLSVSQRSHGWTVWHMDPKFGGGIDLDNILDEFEGHRSKVNVYSLKNVISKILVG